MANKMLHRGSMARLPSERTSLPILSTCILLLIQCQVFHALPTSSHLTNDGFRQQDAEEVIPSASSDSTAYGSAYPYSSYRPGPRLEDSYRPYRTYPKIYPGSPSSDLYALGTASHPNSVYSRQSSASSSSPSLDKVLQLIEKEIVASDLEQQQYEKKISGLASTNDSQDAATSPEQKQISLPLSPNNTPIRDNKPRLLPLPSIQSFSSFSTSNSAKNQPQQQHQQNINDKKQQQLQSATTSTTTTTASSALAEEEQRGRSAEFSPIPPPFAPELDPQYERRQYGLGALTLLDQAGPFW